MSSYSIDNDAFAGMLAYGALLILKTFMMGVITAHYRIKNSAVPSIEDAKAFAPNNPEKHKSMLRPHEDVERVRFQLLFVLTTWSCNLNRIGVRDGVRCSVRLARTD